MINENNLEKFNETMKRLEEFEKMIKSLEKYQPKKLTSTPPFRPYEIQKLVEKRDIVGAQRLYFENINNSRKDLIRL